MARVNLFRPQIDLTVQNAGRSLVTRVTNRVESGARALIPIGDHVSGSGVPARHQRLLDSVYSRVTVNSASARGRVGARTKHAETIHQGSRAHIIQSTRGKMLKFRWERGDFLVAARAGRRRGNRRTGQFHYFVRVRHPGNRRPVRYLTTPLRQFGALHNFRVTTMGAGVTNVLP